MSSDSKEAVGAVENNRPSCAEGSLDFWRTVDDAVALVDDGTLNESDDEAHDDQEGAMWLAYTPRDSS